MKRNNLIVFNRFFAVAISCFLAVPGGVAALAAEEPENSTTEPAGDSGILGNIKMDCTGYSLDETGYKISTSEKVDEEGGTTVDVTVTVEKNALEDEDGKEYYLAQMRYQCGDGEEETAVKKTGTAEQYEYMFEMPETEENVQVTVTADFIPVVWDGTIDLTWYDSKSVEFDIYYPAQLAGAAALCNGIFNNYPTADKNGNPLPDKMDNGQPEGTADKYYNTYGIETEKTVVVGDISLLAAESDTSGSDTESDSTTDLYWCGRENFAGKTLYLMSDMDMGGRKKAGSSSSDVGASLTESYGWDIASPLYMPIGGQYCMDPANAYTKLSASFNGTLDGQGHIVKNIYCDRWSAKYGDSQAIGLVGRLGCHDNDPKDQYASPSVRNVAVDGIFYGQRSIGGIVGKNGKSNSSVIENCLNFATVLHTGAKGGGGIAGSGWNTLSVKNSANLGYIWLKFDGGSGGNAGGLVGSSEAVATNCYTVGYVYSAAPSRAQSLGTNNGGAVWLNCYFLAGSSSSGDGVFGGSAADSITEIDSITGFINNTDFLNDINGTGRAWVSGTADKIKSDGLKEALKNVYLGEHRATWQDLTGTAIPRVFTNDDSKVNKITVDGEAKLLGYVEGQTFDFGTWKMRADYDDGTHEIVEISEKNVGYQKGDCFSAGDTKVTVTVPMEFNAECVLPSTGNNVTVSQDGDNCVITFTVGEVSSNELDDIEITNAPKQTYYVVGDSFDPEGMEVTATYTNGEKVVLSPQNGGTEDDDAESSTAAGGTGEDSGFYSYTVENGNPNSLQTENTKIIVAYTFRDKTKTAEQKITVVDLKTPTLTNDVVQIQEVSDFLWFAYQMKNGTVYNAILLNDIDLTGTGFIPVGLESSTDNNAKAYTGTFDGNGKTVKLDYQGDGKYNALFAFSDKGAEFKDLTVSGRVDSTASSSYTSGIVAYSNGGTITDCVNEASLTGNDYIGGIVACASRADETAILNCANRGNVSAENAYSVGGIVGMAYLARIDSCYNFGTLQKGDGTGGIVGRILYTDVKMENCYNRGNITGTASGYAGGIVGVCGGTSMILRNCYNAGIIEGTSAGNGAVIGYSALTKLTNVSGNYSIACGNCEIIGKNASGTTVFADGNARYIDEAGLKALADTKESTAGLGAAYRKDLKPINDGYPILAWQISKEMSEAEYNSLANASNNSNNSNNNSNNNSGNDSQQQQQTSPPKKGASLKSDGAAYKVTKAGMQNGTVEYSGISGNPKTVSIPATVTVDGITYKVTSIANNAFKGNKKLASVKIGKNVATIGANTFYNCKALKTVTMGAGVTTIGNKAFANCAKLAKITIPAKVKSIGKQAFYGCKNLKNITIKTTKLTKKTVGSKAFGSIYKKATVKVPKNKLKAYKKLLKVRGISSKAKIK